MRRLQAILVDADGALLDTIDSWIQAFDAALPPLVRPLTPSTGT